MRVVQVGKYYPPVPGGIENNVCALCEGLAPHVEVEALVLGNERRTRRETRNGIPVVRVGTHGKVWSTELAPAFFREMARVDADIIHLHMPNPVSELAYLAARAWNGLGRAKFVVTYHAEPPWRAFRMYRPVVMRVLRCAERIVCYTEKYWRGTSVLQGFGEKKGIIPHGLDPDAFLPTPEVEQRAAQLRPKHAGPLVLFVGRLVYYKGLPVLLEAMQHVDATLLVAGAGPLEAAIRESIGTLGLSEKVKLLGRVDDQTKIALYHACDVFVLPATDRAEAYGQVILEAQACRKPVVSTDLSSGVSELNLHRRTGLTVPPGDAAALAEAINTLLRDSESARQFGEAAYARVQRRFTRQRMIEATLELYRDVLRDDPTSGPAVNSAPAAGTKV